MSRNLLKQRPPASPNKPPPAPAKMTPKGQPVPLNVNFFVQGSMIKKCEHSRPSSEKKENRVGIAQVTNLRSHSAQVDKHVLQSMSRSPSVDSSFYNRFERLDRDTIIGDTAFKEKGGRIKSAIHVRTKRSNSAKPRKRSKSAVSSTRKQTHDTSSSAKKAAPNNQGFFETAMSFDDETKQNTLTNAVRQISPRTLGIEAKTGHNSRRRPRSGRKARDRSVSSKRSEGSDSQSSQSAGTGSWCSSIGYRSERHNKKNRARKSRSRTRRPTPRSSDHVNSSKKSSPERNTGPIRSLSAASQRKQTIGVTGDSVGHRFVIKNLKSIPTPTCFEPETVYKGDFAYHYTATGNRPERKPNASRRDNTSVAAINAVKRANDTQQETLKEMKEIDRLFYREDRRPVSSKLPKLKMMVAPTAMPLASLVRSTSAKMLMSNPFEHRRAFDV